MIFREKFLFKYHRLRVHLFQTVIDIIQKLTQALSAEGRYGIDRNTLRFKFRFDPGYRIILRIDHVDLVGGDDLRPLRNLCIVRFQFFVDRIDILHRIASFRGSSVNNMQNQFCAFYMAQKFVPQPDALGSPLDQTRNISDHKAFGVFQIHHPQIGIQCRKMIIRNLRPCIGHLGKQGGLPYIGKTDQPDICDHLQLQKQFQLLRRLSRLCVFRRLHGAGRIVLVAVAAFAAA